jgi:hypothetical protein
VERELLDELRPRVGRGFVVLDFALAVAFVVQDMQVVGGGEGVEVLGCGGDVGFGLGWGGVRGC